MTDRSSPDSEPTLKHVQMWICQACLDGEGEMCHTPGCALIRHNVDLPIMPELYTVLATSPGLEVRERIARAIHECLGGNGWAYSNYGGDEWNDKRDDLLAAADAVIAFCTPAQAAQPSVDNAQLRRAAWEQLKILDHWGADPAGSAHVSSALFQNAAFTIRKLVDALPRSSADIAPCVDRAAVAEAHEHLKAGIDGLKKTGFTAPMPFHKAAHALHHALNDAPPQAASPHVDITGWKLVPDQPTEEMWQAGRRADVNPGDSYTKVWSAMFEAAPNVDDCETTSRAQPQTVAETGGRDLIEGGITSWIESLPTDAEIRNGIIAECAEASENIAKGFRFSSGADTSQSAAINLVTSAIRALSRPK